MAATRGCAPPGCAYLLTAAEALSFVLALAFAYRLFAGIDGVRNRSTRSLGGAAPSARLASHTGWWSRWLAILVAASHARQSSTALAFMTSETAIPRYFCSA